MIRITDDEARTIYKWACREFATAVRTLASLPPDAPALLVAGARRQRDDACAVMRKFETVETPERAGAYMTGRTPA